MPNFEPSSTKIGKTAANSSAKKCFVHLKEDWKKVTFLQLEMSLLLFFCQDVLSLFQAQTHNFRTNCPKKFKIHFPPANFNYFKKQQQKKKKKIICEKNQIK